MVRQGSVTITGQKLDGHKVAMEQVLDAVLREIDYEQKLAQCAHGKGEQDELYGIGLAMSYRGVSLGAEGVDFCAAIINVQADGSILLETGIHENGQGSESAMSLLLRGGTGRGAESDPLPPLFDLGHSRQRHDGRVARHDHGRRRGDAGGARVEEENCRGVLREAAVARRTKCGSQDNFICGRSDARPHRLRRRDAADVARCRSFPLRSACSKRPA